MLNFAHISRWQAAGTHLAISASIALITCLIILFVWYPGPFFSAIGGQVLLALIVGVDVCLGPLLTLVIFNPKKARKLIVLDLSVIAVFQIVALCYGIYSAFVARPVFVVYYDKQFVTVTATDMDSKWLDEAKLTQYRSMPIWGPSWVAIREPANSAERGDYSFFAQIQKAEGLGVQTQPKYFVDLSWQQAEIIQHIQDLSRLHQLHPELNLNATLAGRNESEVGFMPLRTKQQPLTLLLDKRSGEILQILNVRPD